MRSARIRRLDTSIHDRLASTPGLPLAAGAWRSAMSVLALAVALAAQAPAAHAVKLYVQPQCGGQNEFCEIQDAVDAAVDPNGDTILVADGTYGPVTIGKDGITIRARPDEKPLIDATGADHGVWIGAQGVTINGLTVENASSDGFLVEGEGNVLLNNTSDHNGGEGFHAGGEGKHSLTANSATDNVVAGIGCSSASNVLLANRTYENDFNGYVLGDGCTDTELRANLAENNVGRGYFLIFGPTKNRLVRNVARNNGEAGFVLAFFADDNELVGNIAIGNGVGEGAGASLGFAVARRSHNNLLQNNRAEGQPGYGFAVADEGTTGNVLLGNVAKGNQGLFDDGQGIAGFGLITGATGNLFQDNIALLNEGLGFGVDGESSSADNTFVGNDCLNNATGDSGEPGLCSSAP